MFYYSTLNLEDDYILKMENEEEEEDEEEDEEDDGTDTKTSEGMGDDE